MKKLFTFLAATFLIATLHAKIVYLNNELEQPNISENLYTNWSDAYAAVSDGDTIYVSGTSFEYSNAVISKPVTIIGPGYFLTKNESTHVNKKGAIFNKIYLENGASGSNIIGLMQTGANGIFRIESSVDNILVENCYINYLQVRPGNGTVNKDIMFHGCYIGWRMELYNSNRDGIVSDLVITNCIIPANVTIRNGSDGIIAHNLFIGNTLELGNSSSFQFTNNIYLNENENDFTIQPLPDASVSNNISLTGAFGDENDNFSAPQSTLFVSDENASDDGQYMLSENSPAKGVGSNGSDIGPFGGPDPYRLSGLPNLPNIYELSTGGFVSGDELPVTIKIKQ